MGRRKVPRTPSTYPESDKPEDVMVRLADNIIVAADDIQKMASRLREEAQRERAAYLAGERPLRP